VAIILVFVFVDQIEVPTEHPGTGALGPDVSELLEEGDLIGVFLWPIDNGDPPGGCRGRGQGHLGAESVRGEKRVRDADFLASPSKQDTATGANRGQVDVIVELRAQRFKHNASKDQLIFISRKQIMDASVVASSEWPDDVLERLCLEHSK
jgi:hypothetical protein